MLKYNIITLVLLLYGAPALAQRKALTAAESTAVKAKITASTQNLQSLESDFTQTKQLSYVTSPIRSTGKLYFKAPDDIRWEYVSPTDYLVIFNGQTMYTVEDGRSKTTKLTANRRMQGLNGLLAGSLRNGTMLDESQFDISYYREKTTYIAVMVPKDKSLRRYIQQIALIFDKTSSLLTQVTLTDPAGDRTQLAFANQRKNTQLPDTLFMP